MVPCYSLLHKPFKDFVSTTVVIQCQMRWVGTHEWSVGTDLTGIFRGIGTRTYNLYMYCLVTSFFAPTYSFLTSSFLSLSLSLSLPLSKFEPDGT
jgi:hypothetical protein